MRLRSSAFCLLLALAPCARAAPADPEPIRVLVFAGNDAHKWHNWERTTPAIRAALEADPRIRVEVSLDVEDLARKPLAEYATIVMNYANWLDPRGLSPPAKEAFSLYLRRGGGLVVVHFANGAFHFSLPEAGESDWPEYRKIVRRVWNHHGTGESQSGHGAFGPFQVDVGPHASPITEGLGSFQVVDELYFRQDGAEPIEPLLTAVSKVTGRAEPLAFAYRYGDGRVFQTFLGHSERTYEVFEAREVLRRAVAWTAGRPIRPLSKDAERCEQPPPADAAPPNPIVPGRFSNALNGRAASARAEPRIEYRTWPITVECWARLEGREGYNILVACDPKSSNSHWKIFTQPDSGRLALYLPGRTPDHVISAVDVCDGQWRYIAAVVEADRAALYLDGRRAAQAPSSPVAGPDRPEGLAFASLVEGGLGCRGRVDEVRISRIAREIAGVPDKPFVPDEHTVGLWRFDSTRGGQFVDFSSLKNAARVSGGEQSPVGAAQQQKDLHYSRETIGFDWTEQDSVDHRWNEAEIGPFLASTVPLPGHPPVRKGLSIKVGDGATVLYDTGALSFRAAWTGGFLRFDPTRFGIISSPAVDGELKYLSKPYSAADEPVAHRALRLHGERVLLEYTVGPRSVLETPSMERRPGGEIFIRDIQFAPSREPIRFRLGEFPGKIGRTPDRPILQIASQPSPVALAVVSDAVALDPTAKSPLLIDVPASRRPIQVRVLMASNAQALADALDSPLGRPLEAAAFETFQSPGPPLWTHPIETSGVLGDRSAPYAVDQLSLPFENPYGALFFVSGLDLFPNGDLAVCTLHGDVWIVSGVDEELKQLRWRRFATGLFQPLGLRIVDGAVYVLGRDQITRLADLDGDAFADRYECFHNTYETSPGGHDYVACLETDAAGNFYFLHATQGLLKVGRDGAGLETIATGFRNPNGLGVFPDGAVTVAPQEGEWTPSSAIVQVQPGGHYGYGGPKFSPERPLGYDPPLCWIPRFVDNSGGGQVWAPKRDWGPLSDAPLHLSYGQCRVQLVLRERVGETVQGGVVPLPMEFRSGVMRGRVHPTRPELFVGGLRGWVSAAVDDGCLCRIRWTGRPLNVPVAVRTWSNGLSVRFAEPLEPAAAEDPDRYSLTAWNYRYSAAYGSADYRPGDANAVGREEWSIASATLADDGRTVFLEVPDLKPVMQAALEYRIKSADGEGLRNGIYSTIHATGIEAFPAERIVRKPRPGLLPDEIVARLAPGVRMRFEQPGREDRLAARAFAWAAPAGGAAASRLAPGPFTLVADAYLKAPAPDAYVFSFAGTGSVDLVVNGTPVAAGVDLASGQETSVELHKGYNHVEARYASPPEGPAAMRLLWRSDSFAAEPLPLTLLSFDPDEPLLHAERTRSGRVLYESLRCRRCHFTEPPDDSDLGPDLAAVGSRLTASWMARWIAEPRSLRERAEMPAALGDAPDPRELADVVAYLASLTDSRPAEPTADGDVRSGLVLYENLGCIACHRVSTESKPDDRIALFHAAEKFQPRALEEFLRRPHAHYRGSRMPDFSLAPEEAAALAAYLRDHAEPLEGAPLDLALGDAARGKKTFLERGCAHCHRVDAGPAPAEPLGPETLARFDAGCLAPKPEGRAPRYAPADREALARYLRESSDPPAPRSPAEDALLLASRLNCRACHAMDGRAAARGALLAEESEIGLPPESLPDLTWAGEKLNPAWVEEQLAGRLGYKTRPWLKARMPAYPAFAARLARGLAAQHGLTEGFSTPSPNPDPAPADPELAALGRRLVASSGGLDCRSCHALAGRLPTGDERTQLAPGIDFLHVRERMRPEHYRRFLLDPPRFDVATRMPKLAFEGRTKAASVLDGDAARQFEAVWHYLLSLTPEDEGRRAP